MEPWTTHPINAGGMCSKGAAVRENVISERRLKSPMKKVGGKWEKISWDAALDEIATKMAEVRRNYGPDSVMFLGSAKMMTEECYIYRKLIAFWGTNNTDHQARICHSTTVQGLANTWGFGAETNNVNDMRNSRCLFFLGSNAEEAHPVGMQHFLVAKERGAKIIVVDPRYSKTATKADIYARHRPGTDIPLLLGIIHVILENNWQDDEFIKNRTIGIEELREVVKNYPPEVVEDITWVPADTIRNIARTLYENKPSAVFWAMGQTQHTVGSSNIHSDAILQLVLGHAGMSGGGCQALRGHDNVQGSTDMCLLAHLLPAYLSLNEAGWKHWCGVWGIPYEEMKSRFTSQDLMFKSGFSVSRWYEGAILPESQIDQPHNLKICLVWGEALNSVTEMKRQNEAMDKLDLLVIVDPRSTPASALPKRSDGIILLPASTTYEKSGSCTTTGRQVQWRHQIIEPLWESKPDFWILQQLAAKLEEKTGLEFKKYFTYARPEDVWPELKAGMLAIGMRQDPERLKRQQEYDTSFDRDHLWSDALQEYWGLPWPCWNDTHPGTPLLYDDSKPVSKGGHDFRVRWGNAVPENKFGKYVGVSMLREDHPVPQYGYVYSVAEIERALADGEPPTGRGKARIWSWDLADPIPIHREPIESPRPDLVDRYPTYADRPLHYRVPSPFISNQQARRNIVNDYPIILTTGRQVEHMGGGAQTRGTKWLAELQPEMYVEISPNLASRIGVSPHKVGITDEYVWVETLRGKCKVKAYVTEALNDQTAFMPYHWAGWFEGESYEDRYPPGTAEYALGDSVNIICVDGYDYHTQMQETKVCQCKIYKA
jgi:formate dehydrogenase major subunit